MNMTKQKTLLLAVISLLLFQFLEILARKLAFDISSLTGLSLILGEVLAGIHFSIYIIFTAIFIIRHKSTAAQIYLSNIIFVFLDRCLFPAAMIYFGIDKIPSELLIVSSFLEIFIFSLVTYLPLTLIVVWGVIKWLNLKN